MNGQDEDEPPERPQPKPQSKLPADLPEAFGVIQRLRSLGFVLRINDGRLAVSPSENLPKYDTEGLTASIRKHASTIARLIASPAMMRRLERIKDMKDEAMWRCFDRPQVRRWIESLPPGEPVRLEWITYDLGDPPHFAVDCWPLGWWDERMKPLRDADAERRRIAAEDDAAKDEPTEAQKKVRKKALRADESLFGVTAQ